jgi:hypothetical protein
MSNKLYLYLLYLFRPPDLLFLHIEVVGDACPLGGTGGFYEILDKLGAILHFIKSRLSVFIQSLIV